ncbi:hypothetical protein C2E23DRAFT_862746 [Lenzites betulinus]|nr:hypothetical protein C2E23DRAFT_862746 [Lenzites betulinus]
MDRPMEDDSNPGPQIGPRFDKETKVPSRSGAPLCKISHLYSVPAWHDPTVNSQRGDAYGCFFNRLGYSTSVPNIETLVLVLDWRNELPAPLAAGSVRDARVRAKRVTSRSNPSHLIPLSLILSAGGTASAHTSGLPSSHQLIVVSAQNPDRSVGCVRGQQRNRMPKVVAHPPPFCLSHARPSGLARMRCRCHSVGQCLGSSRCSGWKVPAHWLFNSLSAVHRTHGANPSP